MSDKPELILSRLFLTMFSADELRRLLRFGFPDDLANALPGPTAAPVALAEAASIELVQRRYLDDLWPRLIAERPRRQAEIEAARDRIARVDPDPNSASAAIRILFVLSCPRTQEQLATQQEIQQIRDRLAAAQHRDRFTHEVVLAATYDHLRDALGRHKPHILHIACHGTPEAELILDDGHHGEERIDAATLVDLLAVLKGDLRLVVLNACHSTAITRELARAAAGSVVDLVVGMRGAVDDSSAVAFAQVFYASIAAAHTVETSFRLGLNELRRRKADTNIPELLPAEGPLRQHRFVTA